MQTLKLTIIILISAVVASVCLLAPVKPCFADAERYIFYCGNTSQNCREVTTAVAPLAKACLQDINGECAVYDASQFCLQDFLAEHGATVVFCERLADSVNYYCAANLPYSVTLYGQTINLHVCVREDSVLTASPVIFGGY